ncbi:TonB-dependent receptor plug domain-containing protein, partial [Bacteroides uniformis]
MNENRKRGTSNNKILTAIAIASLFIGSSKIMAIETYSENSFGVTEQMQAQTARGIVVDQNGEPIIGASILEKGTTNGVTTDLYGKFSLNVKRGATLVISYIGYKTQEAKADANMKITLTEDSELLDEVVVVGYGVQKKKLVTGATVQVKGEDIAKLNTVDALGALQSQSPGVNITQNNGFLGSGFKVNIRGIGTTGTFSPLYVVDGVANGSIDGLNPSDIESLDVLKDAASAAIYGARAANGVILITT